jgi:hypothetical protein
MGPGGLIEQSPSFGSRDRSTPPLVAFRWAVGAEYSAACSDQPFRDAILSAQGVADGTACRSPSPISLSAPKVRMRGQAATTEFPAPTGMTLDAYPRSAGR